MRNQLPILAAATLAVGMLAACGGSDSNATRERQIEEAAARQGLDVDAKVDASGRTQVEINAGGGKIGQGLDLPADFPDDIDLPGDWNIMAVTAPLPGSHAIQALSNDATPEILQKLRASLGADGWAEVSADTPVPQMSRIGFEKDSRIATFTITENGATRAIQLMTMPKP